MTCVTCLQHGRDSCLEHCEYKFDMPKAINGRFQCPICGQSNNTGSSHCVECGRYFDKLWKCNAPNKGLPMTDKKKALIWKMAKLTEEYFSPGHNPYPPSIDGIDSNGVTYEMFSDRMLDILLDHRDDIFYVENGYHLVKIRKEFL